MFDGGLFSSTRGERSFLMEPTSLQTRPIHSLSNMKPREPSITSCAPNSDFDADLPVLLRSNETGPLLVSIEASPLWFSSSVLVSIPLAARQPDHSRLFCEFSEIFLSKGFRPMPAPVTKKVRADGSATLISFGAPRLTYPSHQLDLCPIVIPLRPIYKRCDTILTLLKPKFDPSMFYLYSFASFSLYRVMILLFRRLQLEYDRSMLLCWYKSYLRTLPLPSPRVVTHCWISLESNGIMTPTHRSWGYQNFFKCFAPSHLFPEPNQELFCISMDAPIIPAWSRRVFLCSRTLVSPKLLDRFVGRACLNPILKPFDLLFHLPPFDRKLGYVDIFQDQTDYKLCVEFIYLHCHEKDDPPALLRFVSYYLRPLSIASSSILRSVPKSLKDFDPMLLNPLMLATNPISVPSVEHPFTSSIASSARAVYDHWLRIS